MNLNLTLEYQALTDHKNRQTLDKIMGPQKHLVFNTSASGLQKTKIDNS